jgi:Icc-related predicted phosphoesterase
MAMKLHILCDLHIEFGDFEYQDVGADVLILAGDTHVGDKGVQWVLKHNFNFPVIYVLGNHEFYRYRFPGLIDQLKKETAGTNVHVLENETVETGGFCYFGCTLWTDMALAGNSAIASLAAADMMNDYRLIRNSHNNLKLTPKETVAWHKQSVEKLREFLQGEDPEKSIVVTHSCPSIESIPERFQGNRLAPAFASKLEPLILECQPRLWIHGHTHDSFDYQIGKTRVVCNPRGYVPNSLNSEFDSWMVVEI